MISHPDSSLRNGLMASRRLNGARQASGYDAVRFREEAR